jgi:hypothetical protein
VKSATCGETPEQALSEGSAAATETKGNAEEATGLFQ